MTDTIDLLDLIARHVQGSLVLDGHPERPGSWTRGGVDDHEVVTARHPTGITVQTTSRRFEDHHAVLWRTSVSFLGTGRAPVLTDLRPLDLELPSPTGEAVLSSLNGSRCRLDDFLPWHCGVADGVHVEPVGGRSSDTAAPFFSIALDGHSVAVAIGWSGQWAFDAMQDDQGVRLRAGQADVRLRLRAGESVTLPSVLAVVVEGPPGRAENALRRLLEREILPHRDDGSVVTPLAHMTMSSFHRTHQVSEASELAAVRRTAELGLEAFWVDACWYGDTPLWAEEVGNWHVRTADFPRGLRPVSDAAHAAGLDFVLWMEPERARRGTRIVADNPELFLPFPDQQTDLLLDLGAEAGRQLALELVSGYIDAFDVDVYRQDFNIAPLPAWRAADEPDRQGLHEIRHVEGLYWLWDRLRERHPGLVIDNCASGGRRIDLETLHRAVPLWRSDAADVGGGAVGEDVSLANQRQVAGLGRFLTQHTGPIWAFDPYSTRSAVGTGFVVYCPLPEDDVESASLRAAVAEAQRLRDVVTGDLHVLEPTAAGDAGWSVVQFHRDDTGAGAVVALRRPGADDAHRLVSLTGIDPDASYQVTFSPTYASGAAVLVGGAELATIDLAVASAPGSLLVEYARHG